MFSCSSFLPTLFSPRTVKQTFPGSWRRPQSAQWDTSAQLLHIILNTPTEVRKFGFASVRQYLQNKLDRRASPLSRLQPTGLHVPPMRSPPLLPGTGGPALKPYYWTPQHNLSKIGKWWKRDGAARRQEDSPFCATPHGIWYQWIEK